MHLDMEGPTTYTGLNGLPTGFRDLDAITGGLTP